MPIAITVPPRVSIILRTRDRRDTLEYALRSCLDQRYRPLELVVVNDGGVDVSDLLARCDAPDIAIRHIIHAVSQGRCHAGNAGLDAATGDYLIFLDDDDWFEPEHLSALVRALVEHPDYLVAYAGVRYCDAPDGPTRHIFNADDDPVAQRLENRIPIHAALFSRRLLEHGCRLDTNLSVFEDWDFWLQCGQVTSFLHVDQISAGYRSGGQSEAGWGHHAQQVAVARQALLAKWKNIWTAIQLDEALRWAQDRLISVQDTLGSAMEAHRDLHEAHLHLHTELVARDERFQIISSAHDELSILHRDLIQTHQTLDAQHTDLLHAQTQLHGEYDSLRAEYDSLRAINQHLDFLYREAELAYRSTLTSTSWRVTRPLRLVSTAGQRLRAGGRTLLGPLPGMLAAVADAHRISGGSGRLLLKAVNRIRQDGVRGAMRRARFHLLRRGKANAATTAMHRPNRLPFCPSAAQLQQLPTVRCGIMVHVFFVDLFPELCRYLARMPIPYHLLLSVPSETARTQILDACRALGEQVRVTVKVVPNRGRDLAPLFVNFRDDIAALDIIGHLHTKRSSYTGSALFGEQWRRYLLDGLLGDASHPRAMLAQFAADPGVGIIYPETFPGLPYWAHTWLSNRAHGQTLLARMGYGDVDFGQYLDYPVGSMFWARTQALKPLFDLALTSADFPSEQGQTDNTLHHAIERCLVFSAHAAGFAHRFQVRERQQICFRSDSAFVIQQYAPHDLAERLRLGCDGDRVVSFDLFDTLLLRPFARPEAVMWMLEEQIAARFGIPDFTAQRQQAEASVRATLPPGQDVTIDDIYRALGQRLALTPQTVADLQALEIATEERLFQLNPVVAEAVRALHAAGRRLLIISDMYLGEAVLRPILKRLDLDLFDHWWVSADSGLRKDRGDVWEAVLQHEGIDSQRLQHVGDNEHSDIQVLVDRGYPHPLHVMRPAALLGVLPGAQALIPHFRQRPSWRNELVLGLIANRINIHLTREQGRTHQPFADPQVFGYGLIGPIIFVFMAWLMQRLRRDGISSVRFLSREGWLLDRLYQHLKTHPATAALAPELPEGGYFYCSRSTSGLAAIQHESDLGLLLGAHYDGTLRQLLTARLGLSDLAPFSAELGDDALDRTVRLPDDRHRILASLRRCLPHLIDEASHLRTLIRADWALNSPAPDPRPAIVDIGYSGTIQLGLMQVLGQPLHGYYFATNASAQRVLEQGGDCASCFGHLLSLESMNDEPLHRYALVLEAILTSPEGQLAGFNLVDGRPTPRFKPGGASQRQFPILERIHDGVLAFCDDLITVLGPDWSEGDWDLATMSGILPLIVERTLDIGALSDALSVEDQYCGNQELPVLDFYDRQKQVSGGI